jgi:flagellar biosynthetic protein FliS
MYTETMSRWQRDYLEERIRSAHPVEIVSMLFEVAIENLNAAIEHLKAHDHFARSTTVTRAQEAVQELLFALNHSVAPAFAKNAASVYHFALDRMAAGHARQSEQAFREALNVLTPLAAAWAEVKNRMCGELVDHKADAEAPAPEAGSAEFDNPYGAYRAVQEFAVQREWGG